MKRIKTYKIFESSDIQSIKEETSEILLDIAEVFTDIELDSDEFKCEISYFLNEWLHTPIKNPTSLRVKIYPTQISVHGEKIPRIYEDRWKRFKKDETQILYDYYISRALSVIDGYDIRAIVYPNGGTERIDNLGDYGIINGLLKYDDLRSIEIKFFRDPMYFEERRKKTEKFYSDLKKKYPNGVTQNESINKSDEEIIENIYGVDSDILNRIVLSKIESIDNIYESSVDYYVLWRSKKTSPREESADRNKLHGYKYSWTLFKTIGSNIQKDDYDSWVKFMSDNSIDESIFLKRIDIKCKPYGDTNPKELDYIMSEMDSCLKEVGMECVYHRSYIYADDNTGYDVGYVINISTIINGNKNRFGLKDSIHKL